MNIAVYKTDVNNHEIAASIRSAIQHQNKNYDVSFDLDDCDNVLRVENPEGLIDEFALRSILESYGYHIEQLS